MKLRRSTKGAPAGPLPGSHRLAERQCFRRRAHPVAVELDITCPAGHTLGMLNETNTNPFEDAARARKVLRLTMSIDAALHGCAVAPPISDLVAQRDWIDECYAAGILGDNAICKDATCDRFSAISCR